jgi:hypothetical protein
MFRVYKPRPVTDKVKAVQVTPQNAADVANLLMGRPIISQRALESDPEKVEDFISGVEFPTLDGVKLAPVWHWVTRNEGNTFDVVEDDKFQKAFEVARNTNGN